MEAPGSAVLPASNRVSFAASARDAFRENDSALRLGSALMRSNQQHMAAAARGWQAFCRANRSS